MAEVWRIDPKQPSPDLIAEAVRVIQAKGVIIYPTETLYEHHGLGWGGYWEKLIHHKAIRRRNAS